MSERIWYLKRCGLFQQLTDDQLQMLESRCRARKYPRNTPIYLPADEANGVMLVAEGRVKIGSITEEGKQTILAFIEPGEIFGELALIDPPLGEAGRAGAARREEVAETVEKSMIVLIPAEAMHQLIEENPQVSLGINKLFGLRRQRIERRLKYLLFRSNRDRLVHLLLELAEQYGQRVPSGIELKIKLSHQDLACIIGSTRETVTVVLGELQSEGRLQLGRRKIVVTDLARLAEIVNLPMPQLRGA